MRSPIVSVSVIAGMFVVTSFINSIRRHSSSQNIRLRVVKKRVSRRRVSTSSIWSGTYCLRSVVYMRNALNLSRNCAGMGSGGSMVIRGLSPMALSTVQQNESERVANERASAIAEARLQERLRKKRFTYGDRLAYEALRVEFDGETTIRNGRVYYSLCAIDDNTIFLHGGQNSVDQGVLDPDLALHSAYLWTPDPGPNMDHSMQPLTCQIPALIGHTSVCYRGARVIIYGGCGPEVSGLFSSVYVLELRLGVCSLLATNGVQPPGRARHACALVGHKVYIHGGHSHTSGWRLLEDFWLLDLTTNSWSRLDHTTVNKKSLNQELPEQERILAERGPGMRFGHHMAVFGDWIYIAFGSNGKQGYNDIWAFNMTGHFWNQITPRGRAPDPRVDCAACVLGKKWIFHGGVDSNTESIVPSIYEFNLETHEGRQMRVELGIVAPLKILPALQGHAMTALHKGERAYLFGGANRMNAVAHVIYEIHDTGKCPSRVRSPAVLPAFDAEDRVPSIFSNPALVFSSTQLASRERFINTTKSNSLSRSGTFSRAGKVSPLLAASMEVSREKSTTEDEDLDCDRLITGSPSGTPKIAAAPVQESPSFYNATSSHSTVLVNKMTSSVHTTHSPSATRSGSLNKSSSGLRTAGEFLARRNQPHENLEREIIRLKARIEHLEDKLRSIMSLCSLECNKGEETSH